MSSCSDSSQDDIDGSNGEVDLKAMMLRRIANVKSAGSFATSGYSASFVLPGIFIENIGQIGLPLSSQDAHTRVQANRKARSGKGSQSSVHKGLRKTLEIEGNKVKFLNNAWNAWVDETARTVGKDLGVVGDHTNVHAEFDKMVLYEADAADKSPNMYVPAI